eukprot:m.249969 g.249969  ORF g.249969 m.249969 type:complete len:187 (-) comp19529_c1_seq15:2476-3036(-)
MLNKMISQLFRWGILLGTLAATHGYIPLHVWRTHATPDNLPDILSQDHERLVKENPKFKFHLVDDRGMDTFMLRYFGGTAVSASYFAISTEFGAMRADMWRYAVLYIHGGVYLDMDSTLNVHLDKFIDIENDTALLSTENSQLVDIPTYTLHGLEFLKRAIACMGYYECNGFGTFGSTRFLDPSVP